LPDVVMTSIAQELTPGDPVQEDRFRASVAEHFCRAHDREQRMVSPAHLGIEEPALA
jgi:hypothetical protein